MEENNKQLLIKEISSRLPYGVKAQVQGWDEAKEKEVNIPLRVYSINTDGYVYFESNDYDVNYIPVEDCLLYLRPMSSMTEEEKEELYHYYCKEIADNLSTPNLTWELKCCVSNSFGTDWLNEHYFDYRGLIEKGLALEAPEEMYKTE